MNLIHIRKCWFIGLAFGLLLMQSNFTAAQISIGVSDLPAQIGTYYLTEDDTLTDLPVTVGAPGANQTWRIEQTYPRVLTGHQLLAPGSAPYHSNFPNSNLVLYFRGRMGNWLHSYYLDDMSGDIYMFQSLTSNGYQLQGMGIDSSKIVHQEFMMDYKGAIDLQPDLMMHPLPLNYGQYWKTVSQFTIEIDTTILGIEATVRFTVKDSLENWVDGWGTLILPYAQYPTLRIKTYATVFEKVYINDTEFRNRKMRSIHYTWIAKNFGTVARVISHSDQSDPNLNDNFTRAKQISRLRWFNPQIAFSLASGSGAPGAVFDLPITISDVTDLKIQAIQFHLSANPQVLQPLEFRKTGTLSENWNIVTFTPTDSGLTLKISGTEPLSGQGTLGIVRYRINPNAAPNAMTPLVLRKLEVKERGPILTATPGQFEVKQSGVPRLSLTPAELNFGVDKNQLTFQIQNSGTGTLTWQVAENPEVSWITSLSPGAGSGATSVTVVVSRDNLASGSYTGQLQVTSNGGNQTVPAKMEVPATQVTYSFPGPGWYLISLPVIPPDNRLSVLFPSVAAAFGYNPVTGMYQTVSQLAPRQGYWLLVLNVSTANVAGAALNRFTQQYTVGWHLMGAVMGSVNFADPADNPNGAIIAAYGWNPVTSQYFPVFPGGTQRLEGGQGYWLAVMQPCELALGGTTLAKAPAVDILVKDTFFKKFGALPPSPPSREMLASASVSQENQLEVTNYPNPFNPETVIYYSLPQSGQTQLFIFNMLGQQVRTLVDGEQAAGAHRLTWDGRDDQGEWVTSGIYFYMLITPAGSQTKKMLLVR